MRQIRTSGLMRGGSWPTLFGQLLPTLPFGSAPSFDGRRISGSFRADNLSGFVRLVCETFDLVPERLGDTEIILRPAR